MYFRPNNRVALLLTAVLSGLMLLMGLAAALAGAATFSELDTNNQGEAYELFPAENGNLWLSDYGAGEVRQINPSGGVYTTYSGLSGASDAQLDAAGNLWWVDFDNNDIGRLRPGDGRSTLWSMPGQGTATGMDIDNDGNIWISHYKAPLVHHFNVSTTQLCAYTFPSGYDSYTSWYVQSDDQGDAWLGGSNFTGLGRLFRLNRNTNAFDTWFLGSGFDPYRLELDAQGRLWWADFEHNLIGYLDPAINEVTLYDAPEAPVREGGAQTRSLPSKARDADGRRSAALNSIPYLYLAGDRVWFSDWSVDWLGQLAPSVAASQTETVNRTTLSINPVCEVLGEGTQSNIQIKGNQGADWQPNNPITTVVDSDGWKIFQLPLLSSPWGVYAEEGNTWVVEQGSNKVGWVQYVPCYYLTLAHDGSGADPTADPPNSAECGEGQYAAGETITLTAIPSGLNTVGGWTGTDNDDSTAFQNLLTMPAADHMVQVHYTPCYPLTTNKSGNGGDPSASPENTAGCPANYYKAGETITMTAAPDSGHGVSGWSGVDDPSARGLQTMLTMPALAHEVSVAYGQCYSLTFSHSGSGADPTAEPTSSAGCDPGQYVPGFDIKVTAWPDTGWSILVWHGTENNETVALINQVIMPAGAHEVSVDYTQCHLLSLYTIGSGADLVAVPGNSDGCPSSRYYSTTVITLTSSPANGWAISSWQGTDDDQSTGAVNLLTMPNFSHETTVTYGQCFRLSLSYLGLGDDPIADPASWPGCSAGHLVPGKVISLIARPAVDWSVYQWTGTDDDSSTLLTNQLTMPQADRRVSVSYRGEWNLFLPVIVK